MIGLARVERAAHTEKPVVRRIPLAVLGLTLLLAAALSVIALVAPFGMALGFDYAQQIVTPAGGAVALALMLRRAKGPVRLLYVALIACEGLYAFGQLVWDVTAVDGSSLVGDILLLLASGIGAVAIVWATFWGLAKDTAAMVGIDGVILFLSGAALAGAFTIGSGSEAYAASLGVAIVIASGGACVIALVSRRIPLRAAGPWAFLMGAVLIAGAWVAWISDASAPSQVGVMDFVVSGGMLMIAIGGVTFDLRASASRVFDTAARFVECLLPAIAIFIAIWLFVDISRVERFGAVEAPAAASILVVAFRQIVVTMRERRARCAERRSAALLETEIRERADTLVALARLEAGATPEETAGFICDEALRIDGVQFVFIHVHRPDGLVVSLAMRDSLDRSREFAGRAHSPEFSEMLRRDLEEGSRAHVMTPDAPDVICNAMYETGIRETISAPIRWNDRVIGDIGFGASSLADASLDERMTTLKEFAVVSAALLGPAVVERERVEQLRQRIGTIVDNNGFRPVFQPVVRLATSETIGFEALTRFSDGQRPEVRFGEAAEVGMGKQLEVACLMAAVRRAADLPKDAWLALNVSPELATEVTPLLGVLAAADRPVVLEITEHVEIDDYERLVSALATIGNNVKISVDDAGAGHAGLRHILELRPDFVKLDLWLVRGIDTDPARQAMVESMVRFASRTGCTVIAEGIETEAELEMLRSLEVELGQGYLLGHPSHVYCQPVDDRELEPPTPVHAGLVASELAAACSNGSTGSEGNEVRLAC